MNIAARFETERLIISVLHPFEVTTDYVDGLNDPEVNRYLVDVRLHRQTMESVQAYAQANLDSPSSILLGLFLKSDRHLIGTLRLSGIHPYHRFATVGICIFDKQRGWRKGYGHEALQRLIQFAFDDLKLHSLDAGAFLQNTASVQLFKSCGFVQEGLVQDKLRLDDKYEPAMLLGLVNTADHNLT